MLSFSPSSSRSLATRAALCSACLLPAAAGARLYDGAPVVAVQDRLFLHLESGPAPELWGGTIEVLAESDATAAYVVPFTGATATTEPWTEPTVTVFGAKGPVCSAKLEKPVVLIRFDEESSEGERSPADRDATIARAKTRAADAALALPLTPVGACEGALYAVHPGRVPSPLTLSPADASLRKRALEQFRALPFSRAQEAPYAQWRAGQPAEANAPERWEAAAGAPGVQLLEGSGRKYVVVSVVDDQGCGDFFRANATVVFALEGKALRPLTNPVRPPEGITVRAAADIDSDGVPELFSWDGILRATSAPNEQRLITAPPSYFCPC